MLDGLTHQAMCKAVPGAVVEAPEALGFGDGLSIVVKGNSFLLGLKKGVVKLYVLFIPFLSYFMFFGSLPSIYNKYK